MELKGAVAVVTGGASGIGEAVAKSMALKGVKVVIGDMDQKGLERVSGEITAAGGAVAFAKCNVTSDEDVANLMDLAISTFGQLNICVSSAGIIKDGLMINTDKETGKVKKAMTTDQFKAVIDVNLVGSFITIREASIRMANNPSWKGLLVPISSVNKEGQTGQMNYASAKAAIALWPKIIVGEFQMKGIQNIRCVAIAPGYVGTPMVKGMNQDALNGILKSVHINRLIEPSEIADIIMFAAQNEAVDATCLEITGGLISNGLAK
jgi:3-oxoacyl-[acyl-carrier protein] reductase